MSKSIPLVEKYMSTTPHSIGSQQTIAAAHDVMKEFKIRHLPVLNNGQLAGIVSDRDIKLAMSIHGVDPLVTLVSEISNDEIFLVQPKAKLDEVVQTMGDKKIGSVLVVDNHRLVGIFTTTDAMRAFKELLNNRFAH